MQRLLLLEGIAPADHRTHLKWQLDRLLRDRTAGDMLLLLQPDPGATEATAWFQAALESCRYRGLRRLVLAQDGLRYLDGTPDVSWREDEPDVAAYARRTALRACENGWEAELVTIPAEGDADRPQILPRTLLQPRLTRYDYVFIDLETSGLSHKVFQPIEIGAVHVSSNLEADFGLYEAKIHLPHGAPFEAQALAVNGYTEEAWRGALALSAVMEDFLRWLPPQCRMGGHNIPFDREHLRSAWRKTGLTPHPFLDAEGIDTQRMARVLLKDTGKIVSASLDTACNYLGIDNTGVHRALPDARRSLAVARKLKEVNCG